MVGFEEFLSGELRVLEESGLKIVDLEREIHAFNAPLPRIGAIQLDEFVPEDFI